ncbi:hypothetical protein H5410_012556 [Solanum commersonii]|uniref:Protein FAR1-RELATED SEQUENCE n=1 Tax=Solanum commersonii TaxID=4109 RepID=A0A9J6AT15_SOLCO|nr:hypothetical protein H5410_012556 [Solanum commersonii]
MFRITSFEEKHNHPLVSPSLAHLLPSQRKIKVAQAYEIDLLDDSGIRPKASFDLLLYEEDFLSAWQEMLDKYDLADNSWLKTTFAIREKWSMTYGRNTFSAGELSTYNVSALGSVKEHVVTVKRSITQVSCSCKLIEFLGILCRHPLKILDTLNIKDRIPIQYILKRWTKDVTNINEMDAILEEKDIDPKVEVTARYRHLCHTFVQISKSASESKEGYELVVNGANEMINAKLKDIKKRTESPDKSAPSNTTQNEPSDWLKRKEPTRRSNTRPKSFTEKSKKKSRTSLPKSLQCQTDQQLDHLPQFQVPHTPLFDTSNAMDVTEGSFRPLCPSQFSQGYSSNEIFSTLIAAPSSKQRLHGDGDLSDHNHDLKVEIVQLTFASVN